MPLANGRGQAPLLIEWNDADVVNGLLQDAHGVARLHDLEVAVVPRACAWRPERDAALRQRPIFRTIGAAGRTAFSHLTLCAGIRASPLLRFRSQRWKPAIRRNGDQRCAMVDLALDHPELVVIARRRIV